MYLFNTSYTQNMARSIISEGNTTNEAIKNGLKKLNLTEKDVDIKVLEEEDKKVFFDILTPRVVKVQITEKEIKNNTSYNENKKERKNPTSDDYNKAEENLKKFLEEFTNAFKNISYEIDSDNERLKVIFSGDDASRLIGHRGETINSLQNLLSVIANKNTEIKVGISIDILNYREKREEELKSLAKRLEKTVKRTHKKVTLEPMSAFERKIIHTELQSSEYVTTYSIGEEPHRRIVIDIK